MHVSKMSHFRSYDYELSFLSKVRLIFIRKISHLNPLWKRDLGELGKGLLQKFGFIKRVDKGWITTVKGLESRRFEG